MDLIKKKTDYNDKITGLENETPDVSSLVRKTDYDTKISENEGKVTNHNQDKYINTEVYIRNMQQV